MLSSQTTLKFNDKEIKDDTVLTQEQLDDWYKVFKWMIKSL
ncbi:MAG: hypothetical protein ACI4WW_08525 [Candidatus Coprovivens sp.]